MGPRKFPVAKVEGCLFFSMFGDFRLPWEFFHSIGDVTITGERLQILTLGTRPLSSEGSITWHAYCATGQPFGESVTLTPVAERLAVSTATTANPDLPNVWRTLYMYYYATAAVKVGRRMSRNWCSFIVLYWIRDIYCKTQSQVIVCDYNHCLIFLLDFHRILSGDSTFWSVLFATFCHFYWSLELLNIEVFLALTGLLSWITFSSTISNAGTVHSQHHPLLSLWSQSNVSSNAITRTVWGNQFFLMGDPEMFSLWEKKLDWTCFIV